jgi:hypothetical protein
MLNRARLFQVQDTVSRTAIPICCSEELSFEAEEHPDYQYHILWYEVWSDHTSREPNRMSFQCSEEAHNIGE